jgi:RNA polymerase sigma factor (sigma-70 family)
MAESLPPELSALLNVETGAGREAAWQSFIDVYSPLLLHAARSASEGYDAGMDSYAYILDKLKADDYAKLRAYRLDPRSRFSTWLVFVARRLCIDRRREQYGRWSTNNTDERAHEERVSRRRLVDLAASEMDLAMVEDSAIGDPEQQCREAELRGALTDAIGQLEPRDQLLLTLRFVDGLSAREIEALQGWESTALVYRRLDQLKLMLRRHLVRRGIDNPVP